MQTDDETYHPSTHSTLSTGSRPTSPPKPEHYFDDDDSLPFDLFSPEYLSELNVPGWFAPFGQFPDIQAPPREVQHIINQRTSQTSKQFLYRVAIYENNIPNFRWLSITETLLLVLKSFCTNNSAKLSISYFSHWEISIHLPIGSKHYSFSGSSLEQVLKKAIVILLPGYWNYKTKTV